MPRAAHRRCRRSESGSSSLKTLVLPGLDGTAELRRAFVAALPEAAHAVALAFPADRVMGYAELEALVAEAIADGQPVVLIGESYSGPLALRVAARQGARIAAVVLVATFVRRPIRWIPACARFLTGPWLFRRPVPAAVIRGLLAGRDAPESLVAAARDAVGRVAPEVLAARLREVFTVDAHDALCRCAAPLLYLGGTRDRLVGPASIREIKRLRPDVEVALLDAPHMVLERRPQESAALVAAFLERAMGATGHPCPPRAPHLEWPRIEER